MPLSQQTISAFSLQPKAELSAAQMWLGQSQNWFSTSLRAGSSRGKNGDEKGKKSPPLRFEFWIGASTFGLKILIVWD